MDLVGAAFGDGVDDPAGGAAIFGGETPVLTWNSCTATIGVE